MELMSTSFDKFYKYVYSVLDDVIPEEILGKITLAVSILLSFFCVCVFFLKLVWKIQGSYLTCKKAAWSACSTTAAVVLMNLEYILVFL